MWSFIYWSSESKSPWTKGWKRASIAWTSFYKLETKVKASPMHRTTTKNHLIGSKCTNLPQVVMFQSLYEQLPKFGHHAHMLANAQLDIHNTYWS
jgi:hypothetical protein